MMNETDRLTAPMEAFRLVRNGIAKSYTALKTVMAEIYPEATEEEIRTAIRRAGKMADEGNDYWDDEDD